MKRLLEIKEYLMKFYGRNSLYVNKGAQFLLALLTFTFISNHVGFSSVAAHPLMTIALSIICTFLPITMTVVLATVAVLMQFYTLSLGIALLAGVLFLVMYVMYFRYTPGKAVILLLVPVSFMLGIPVAVPIVCGLLGSPIWILPITMGTMIYYMVDCVKSYNTLLETVGETGMTEQLATYGQQLFTSREMWCTMIAFAICLLLVYSIRRMAVEHSWKIAIVTGALAHVIAMALGYVMMDIPISYTSLIVGSFVAVILSLLIEVFVLSVDYSRTEYLQFEDDEYYYHVKAVPKVSVSTPEKTVKRIHERQMTGVMDVEQIKSSAMQAKQNKEDSEIQRIIEEELNRS